MNGSTSGNASGSRNNGSRDGGTSGHRGRDVKGKGRGGGDARGGRNRVRKAADYTPAQTPRMDQAAVAEASRLAIEKAERERETLAAAAGLEAAEEEPETCYICAELVRYFTLGTCSHRTCHVCSLRLRALYKKRECTFCKVDLPSVITTIDANTPFHEFPPDAFPHTDAKLAIAFETSEMMEDTLTLLRFNCPQIECDYLASGWADLKKHVKAAHGLVFCDLCTKNKKIFTHEHTLYTPQQLQSHIKEGDAQAGAGDDEESTGFTGHPMCEFCRITFYDSDQLFTHCRDKHEQCFLCIRNGSGRYQYYVDYPHLETHFQASHHLCLNPMCLEQRFVVFDTEIDLQAHQVQTHGETIGKTARRLETNFTYGQTRDPRAGGGVSMAPNRTTTTSSTRPVASTSQSVPVIQVPQISETPPSSSAVNGVIGSRGQRVPGLNRGGFNTQLSDTTSASRKNGKASAAEPPILGDSVTGVHQSDPLMAVRHSSLLMRVSEAVNGNESKLAAFRAAIRAYRASETSANDAIGTIHHLLDNQLDITGRIVTSAADLLDSNDKRDTLLTAWDAYSHAATSNVDLFPSLVPTAPSTSANGAGYRSAPARRGIIPKSAKQNNAAVWERVEQAAANKNVGAIPGLTRTAPKEKFPALPSASHSVSQTAGVRGATPWASTRQQTKSPGSTYFPVASSASTSLMPSPARSPAIGRPAPAPAATPRDFPSLPNIPLAQARAAQKAAIFSRSGNSTPNMWTAGSPPAPEAIQTSLANLQIQSPESGAATQAGAAASRKKKGKQILFHHGL